MVLQLHRSKNNKLQELNVFLHHHNWAVCPLHASIFSFFNHFFILFRPDIRSCETNMEEC
jgi:hypothetical protein